MYQTAFPDLCLSGGRYYGCWREEWEVYDRVGANSSPILLHTANKYGPTAVNVIFTPLNEILSIALSDSGKSGRVRIREKVVSLMR